MKSQKNPVKDPLLKEGSATESITPSFLILHNDEVNTFDFVIETLIEICDHKFEQAEQCAYITHYKGKCDVKKGTRNKLKSMRKELIDRGLNATID